MPSMHGAFPPFQRHQGTNIFDLDGQAPAQYYSAVHMLRGAFPVPGSVLLTLLKEG